MTSRASQRSLGRRIVSRFGENPERRQSFGRNQFHFYFTPFAVMPRVLGTVPQHVLVAQFDANLGGHIGQIVGIINGEGTASGDFGDIGKQRPAPTPPREWP